VAQQAKATGSADGFFTPQNTQSSANADMAMFDNTYQVLILYKIAGILHSSVYTFQECGRQEINSFVRTFWCQVSGVRSEKRKI